MMTILSMAHSILQSPQMDINPEIEFSTVMRLYYMIWSICTRTKPLHYPMRCKSSRSIAPHYSIVRWNLPRWPGIWLQLHCYLKHVIPKMQNPKETQLMFSLFNPPILFPPCKRLAGSNGLSGRCIHKRQLRATPLFLPPCHWLDVSKWFSGRFLYIKKR